MLVLPGLQQQLTDAVSSRAANLVMSYADITTLTQMSAAVIVYTTDMARWEPGAAERLQKAALNLFVSRGFEQTTAADIAQAAGLTQRTFFRYFGDKRDVLFYGQDQFVQIFLSGIDAAPVDAPAMELVASALASAAALFPDSRRPYALMRQTVIDENPALRERERHKLADLAGEVAGALRARGVREPAATLAAESCTSVFGVAFTQWIRERQRSLADIVASVLDELLALNAVRAQPPNEPARPPDHRLTTQTRID